MEVPASAEFLTPELSAEVWAHTTLLNGGYLMSSQGRFWIRQSSSGVYEAAVTLNGLEWAVTGQTKTHDGAWHHVALTFDGDELRLLVDGKIDASRSTVGVLGGSGFGLPVYIGNSSTNIQSTAFAGDLDEAALYGTALSQGDVMSHANNGNLSTFPCSGTQTSTYAQAICDSSPVAYWRLGEASGTTVSDLTTPPVNGSSSGVTFGAKGATADDNTAARFGWSGSTARYIQSGWYGYGRFSKPEMTAEVWARTTEPTAGYLLSRANQFSIRQTSSGAYEAAFTIGSTEKVVTGTTKAHDGAWHHVAATYDGSKAVIYLDGKVDGTLNVSGPLGWGSEANTFIGNSATNLPSRNFPGDLDEAAIYNRALTESALKAHADLGHVETFPCDLSLEASSYSQVVCNDSPVGYWRLGETTGTTFKDRTTPALNAWSGGVTLGVPGAIPGDSNSAVRFATGSYTSRFISAPWYGYGRFARKGLTAEIWARASDAWGGYLLSREGQFALRQSPLGNGRYDAILKINGTTYTINGTTNKTDGSWHHVAVTYDGSDARLFVDGTLDGSLSIAGTIGWGTEQPLFIGNAATNQPSWNFPGDLDEAAIYNEPLSQSILTSHSAFR
jgi:hypothetical protein